MKYLLQIDIEKDKKHFIEELFKSISFIKNVKLIEPNEITKVDILQSIEDYETGKSKPTALNLSELKSMINA